MEFSHHKYSVSLFLKVTSFTSAPITELELVTFVVHINTLYTYTVGFSLEEGRHLLAQWVKVKPEQLSSYADQILEFCRYMHEIDLTLNWYIQVYHALSCRYYPLCVYVSLLEMTNAHVPLSGPYGNTNAVRQKAG